MAISLEIAEGWLIVLDFAGGAPSSLWLSCPVTGLAACETVDPGNQIARFACRQLPPRAEWRSTVEAASPGWATCKMEAGEFSLGPDVDGAYAHATRRKTLRWGSEKAGNAAWAAEFVDECLQIEPRF
jgi:hypothetical protein